MSAHEFKKGDIAFIHSIYGNKKLFGEVIAITETKITLLFEESHHVETYDIGDVYKTQK